MTGYMQKQARLKRACLFMALQRGATHNGSLTMGRKHAEQQLRKLQKIRASAAHAAIMNHPRSALSEVELKLMID